MSDDTQVNIEPSQTTDVGEPVNEVNEYETKIAQLTEELEKTKKNLENSRKSEKYAKTKVELTAEEVRTQLTNEFKTQIDELTNKLSVYQEKETSQVIKAALDKELAIDSDALIKLVDKNDVEKSITELKTKHPALFKQPVIPTVDKSTEGMSVSGIQQELEQARRNGVRDFTAIYAKYGVKF